MSEGYRFKATWLAVLETFPKATDRDALNMAIHKFMLRGEMPEFTKPELTRVWLWLSKELVRSRKISTTMLKDTSDNLQRYSKDVPKIHDNNFKDTSNNLEGKEKGKKKPPLQSPHKESLKEITPIAPKSGNQDVGFNLFWEQYPRKVGKIAARKAFERAIKLATIEDMLMAIDRQRVSDQWKKDNGAYIPHPATWLNQGRWDDDCGEQVIEEKPRKPVPKVSQCPACGSYDLAMTMDRCICRGCGAVYDYNHVKGRWEKAE